MITGLGMDLIEVDRIAHKIGKDQGFRELVFSAREIDYCESKANKYEHYAARFAAKEAFFKALGTGWLNGTAFNEVEIGHDENGRPVINLLGETSVTIKAFGYTKISLSLTHLQTIAGATVIIEQLSFKV